MFPSIAVHLTICGEWGGGWNEIDCVISSYFSYSYRFSFWFWFSFIFIGNSAEFIFQIDQTVCLVMLQISAQRKCACNWSFIFSVSIDMFDMCDIYFVCIDDFNWNRHFGLFLSCFVLLFAWLFCLSFFLSFFCFLVSFSTAAILLLSNVWIRLLFGGGGGLLIC